MSPRLEPKTCPDCGATFYLTPADTAEVPAHGCPGPSGRPAVSAQASAPPEATLPAAPPGSAQHGSELPQPAGSGGLFDALKDQERQPPRSASPQGELREDTARSLRERGYVLTQDAHGVRITSTSSGVSTRSNLSPTDIVRMAAELDGGVKQTTSLQTCPKCQSRTPAGEPKCQWCGEPFPPARAAG